MYFNTLSEIRKITTKCFDKNGLFPFKFGYLAKIENLTLSSFFLPEFIDKSFSRVSYRNSVI